jgi:hypothetical protein
MRPDKKIVKYRAMVLYPNTDLKELVDVINPDNNILAKFEDFDEGEIIFSDNLKVVPYTFEEDTMFITIPLAIKKPIK